METKLLIYDPDDWDHGLRCIDCNQLFQRGDIYTERLSGMIDDMPVAEIICIACAIR